MINSKMVTGKAVLKCDSDMAWLMDIPALAKQHKEIPAPVVPPNYEDKFLRSSDLFS